MSFLIDFPRLLSLPCWPWPRPPHNGPQVSHRPHVRTFHFATAILTPLLEFPVLEFLPRSPPNNGPQVSLRPHARTFPTAITTSTPHSEFPVPFPEFLPLSPPYNGPQVSRQQHARTFPFAITTLTLHLDFHVPNNFLSAGYFNKAGYPTGVNATSLPNYPFC